MSAFTSEELTSIARSAFGAPHAVERDGVTYVFEVTHDDITPMEYVNDMDGLGRLAWPVNNRYTGRSERPPGFTGAAHKFGPTPMHDEVWWEPYRDDSKVYGAPEDIQFMRELLDWGIVCLSVQVKRTCPCCGHSNAFAHEKLGGIESPLIGDGNYDYLAECFDEMLNRIVQSTQLMEVST